MNKRIGTLVGYLLLACSMIYMILCFKNYSSLLNGDINISVNSLLTTTGVGIILLLVLVLLFKLHAFLSLIFVSMFVGVSTGMPFSEILKSMEQGMGGTLGFVATVVGLGAIFGEILEASGGAESLAVTLTKKFGKENSSWALMLTGFLVAIPVFFDVGFIILVPLVYSLAKEAKKSILYYGIPLLAGLAVTHTFIPPTPGPVAVASILGADIGWVILFGAIIGFPVAILSGPLWGNFISKRIYLNPDQFLEKKEVKNFDLPTFKSVIIIILVPLVLILMNTVSDTMFKLGVLTNKTLIDVLSFLGHPFFALSFATIVAIYFLGIKKGISKDEIMRLSNKSLGPAGLIILVTGAGGVFKQLLINSGIGFALAEKLSGTPFTPLVLAFIIAAAVRITQGSATVAMITAAGLVAPLLENIIISGPQKALIVISVASGATVLSHVNDSGFWLVGKYFGMNEKETLKSWTVMETIIGVAGFGFAYILYPLV
ncbi:MAG: gluconate:H+ symporter [Fusobacteriaceae bacterium]